MSLADPTPFLAKVPVIPVLTIRSAAEAVPLARALAAGGLPVIEVTLRSDAALEAIARIAREVSEITVGAGTLMQPADVAAAAEAGAQYLVSPGTPVELAEAFARSRLPAVPGCATVSEAMALRRRGFTLLKFFPAQASGGVAWLKAVTGPLPDLRFCPTGGIDANNAADYLALPNVICVGGSWVAPQDAIARGDYKAITALARAAAVLRR